MADRIANPAPKVKEIRIPFVGKTANIMAAAAAPMVCPKSLAMPSIPLAPPLRLGGAEAMIVLLLGVKNVPKPMPPNTIRHIMSKLVG